MTTSSSSGREIPGVRSTFELPARYERRLGSSVVAPESRVVQWFEDAPTTSLFLSALVVGEIRKGVERLRSCDSIQAGVLEEWLEGLRRDFADRILPVTAPVAEAWGRLVAPAPLPVVDALIAATALVHGLTLVTRDTGALERTGIPCSTHGARKLRGDRLSSWQKTCSAQPGPVSVDAVARRLRATSRDQQRKGLTRCGSGPMKLRLARPPPSAPSRRRTARRSRSSGRSCRRCADAVDRPPARSRAWSPRCPRA